MTCPTCDGKGAVRKAPCPHCRKDDREVYERGYADGKAAVTSRVAVYVILAFLVWLALPMLFGPAGLFGRR